MPGISVVICCHNSASLLRTTLAHLMIQESPTAPWEVLLVDNGSTDATAEVARSYWQSGPAPLRIVEESRVGLRHARERSLAEAQYGLLAFVDDDNWVAGNWVRTVCEIMCSEPRLGAVGSIRTPTYEAPPPAWFDDYHSPYAVLTDHELEHLEQPPEYLAGAGLCVRKAAWQELVQNGYEFQLTGRKGKKLQGGEDAELTMALRLSGWQLRIDPRLRLQHFMPGQRLQWTYLRRLQRNYGVSHVILDAYSNHSVTLPPGFRRWVSDRWWYQFATSLKRIASRPHAAIAALLTDSEGWSEIIEIETSFGRAVGLLQTAGRYGRLRSQVRNASWRKQQTASRIAADEVNHDILAR
jgi:GT2 family glycosyltransferase